MEANFICKCGEEQTVPLYKIAFKSAGKIYQDNSGKELICKCGLKLQEKECGEKIEIPYFGKFASMSGEDKKKMLKKRSTEHFNREVKDAQHQMHKDSFNSLIEK